MGTALEDLTGGVQAPDTLGQPGVFTIKELNPPKKREARDFTAILRTMPVVTAGYGGWSRTARAHRVALTEWVGRDSISITFDFLIDEYTSGKGDYVESQCRNLDRMAGIGSGGGHRPPLVSVDSDPAKIIPFGEAWSPNMKWFIESLTWTADIAIVGRRGNRLRAGGTIILTQYVEDTRLTVSKRATSGKGSGTRRKTYTVKKGDTLSEIAARKDVYGDASQWKKIKDANKIRDPKHLKVGKVLKIP